MKKNNLSLIKICTINLLLLSCFSNFAWSSEWENFAEKMSGEFIVDKQKANDEDCKDFSLTKEGVLDAINSKKKIYLNLNGKEPAFWLHEFKISETTKGCRIQGSSTFVSKNFDSNINLKINEKISATCKNPIFSGKHQKTVIIKDDEIHYTFNPEDENDTKKTVCVWNRKK